MSSNSRIIQAKRVTVQQAWQVGMQNSMLLVTAMNIGTAGFFWWYLPEFVSTYADNVMDVEKKAKMALTRVPELKVSWGNQALRFEDLTQVSIVFSHMASVREESRAAVYQRYFKALALMAKNDIFFQFEGNLLIEFHLVLREAMASYGDWDGKDGSYDAAVDATFQTLKVESDYISSLHDLIGVAMMTMRGENKTRPVSLEDVIKIKVACDLFLIVKARVHMRREIDAIKAQESAGGETSRAGSAAELS